MIDTRGIKLGIGYSFFQSEREIPRSLFPIAPYVYKIYAVDGRYTLYWGGPNSNFSTDGSVRLIESLPNAEVFYYSGFQSDKRQVYLDQATDCDFLFVLDTDEYIIPEETDWNLFYKELEELPKKYPDMYIFGVNMNFSKDYVTGFNDVTPGGSRPYMRVYREPSTLQYDITHYTFTKKGDKGHNWLWGPHLEWFKGLELHTDSTLRDDETLDYRDQWAVMNMTEERKRLLDATRRGEMA